MQFMGFKGHSSIPVQSSPVQCLQTLHLVLVGETVATCSLPSLTWIPSSCDVMCVLPPDRGLGVIVLFIDFLQVRMLVL